MCKHKRRHGAVKTTPGRCNDCGAESPTNDWYGIPVCQLCWAERYGALTERIGVPYDEGIAK